MKMPISLTPAEKKTGSAYFLINLFLLPGLISFVGNLLKLDLAQVNLCYYAVNIAAVGWIFRKFLYGNLLVALDQIFPVIWYALLGYLGYNTLGEFVNLLIYSLFPGYVNFNDASVSSLVLGNPLFAICIITLVPATEETLYRGLVFRGLYDRSPSLAYAVSMTLFAIIHVAGYIGILSPAHLALSVLQYLPAGYCLCFVYRHSGTILCPIFVHMAVNAISVFSLMR